MEAIIFDTETTDAVDGELIEAAYFRVHITGRDVYGTPGTPFVQRYKPSKPISFGAMATHHILEADLDGCPPSAAFDLPRDVEYLIGHNVDFDWKVIGSPSTVKRICTLAMARHVWPQADSHRLGALMYQLADDPARTREELREAHSALADVGFCMVVLQAIAETVGGFDSFEQMWQFSEEARVPSVIGFGKHKGTAIADLPRDYVGWLLRQADIDPYLRKALEA
jgi:exodeoxyribonuclease X